MVRFPALLAGVLLSVVPVIGHAQVVVARDGYEAFPNVQYLGGDARFPKKQFGVLVFTDSTVGFYRCNWTDCADRKGTLFQAKDSLWIVPLKGITAISTSSANSGPSVTNRLLFGTLATDSNVEQFAFAHDTQSSAEAPVFKTPKSMSAALEAKMRFRLRKLGVTVPQ